MDALWVGGDLASVLAPLFTMPRQSGDDAMTAKVYRMAIEGLPYASISHAVQYFLFDNPEQRFCPTPAQLKKRASDHADSIRLKTRHLAEAIANAEANS